jgi:hypothetical protein
MTRPQPPLLSQNAQAEERERVIERAAEIIRGVGQGKSTDPSARAQEAVRLLNTLVEAKAKSETPR